MILYTPIIVFPYRLRLSQRRSQGAFAAAPGRQGDAQRAGLQPHTAGRVAPCLGARHSGCDHITIVRI